MLSDQDLLKLLLPEFLVQHFDILNAEPHDAELHIYFEEKKGSSAKYNTSLILQNIANPIYTAQKPRTYIIYTT